MSDTTSSAVTSRLMPIMPATVQRLSTVLAADRPQRIALWLKLAYTAFMAVLVPVYWTSYGPANFLYFCDMALILTLIGVWREDALLISMPAVGILAPQILWITDYILNFGGIHLTGMTDYMFDAKKPMFLRGLSLFHGWLPILLVYLVARVGYDKRAFLGWGAVAWAAMFVAYFFLPGPSPDAGNAVVNVNYVFGMSDTAAQTWMPGWMWFCGLLIAVPVLLALPMHVVLKRVMPAAKPAA